MTMTIFTDTLVPIIEIAIALIGIMVLILMVIIHQRTADAHKNGASKIKIDKTMTISCIAVPSFAFLALLVFSMNMFMQLQIETGEKKQEFLQQEISKYKEKLLPYKAMENFSKFIKLDNSPDMSFEELRELSPETLKFLAIPRLGNKPECMIFYTDTTSSDKEIENHIIKDRSSEIPYLKYTRNRAELILRTIQVRTSERSILLGFRQQYYDPDSSQWLKKWIKEWSGNLRDLIEKKDFKDSLFAFRFP